MLKNPYVGQRVMFSDESKEKALPEYRDQVFIIERISDHCVPSKEFSDPASSRYKEKGGHPGYDEGVAPALLMDLEGLDFSFYDWELDPVYEG